MEDNGAVRRGHAAIGREAIDAAVSAGCRSQVVDEPVVLSVGQEDLRHQALKCIANHDGKFGEVR